MMPDEEEAQRMALAEMARGSRRSPKPAAVTVVIGGEAEGEEEDEEGSSPEEC